MTSWTPQQVVALAPDASSAKAGRELAVLRKWLRPGRNEQLIWGEHQGSGASPYQTLVDLDTPLFHCSCPSRKQPCKHVLGLLLLFAQQPNDITRQEAPLWVQEWLTARSRRTQQRAAKAEQAATPAEERQSGQTQRANARQAKVAAGLADMRRWLDDLVRQGLANAPNQPYSFWANQAARLVDAQAPGVANLLLEMAAIPATGEGWPGRLLTRLARLHLLLEAYSRLETLPVALQADVRTLIGWTRSQEEVLQQPGLRDQWQVVGQQVTEENTLRVQRTWLLGSQSGQPALILNFAAPGQTLETSLAVGHSLDGEMVFYPSAAPLRGLLKTRFSSLPLDKISGVTSVRQAIANYRTALNHLPWLDRFPVALQQVTPIGTVPGGWVRDVQGVALPLSHRFAQGWQLLALSGGAPIDLFGEWHGDVLYPLSVCHAGRVIAL